MSSIYTYSFLTPAASGVDVSLINSNLNITGAPKISMKMATQGLFVDAITETREVITLTPTQATAIGQVYSIRISQFNKALGRNVSKSFSYTSVTASDSTSVISAALIAVINLDPELAVTASGSTTVVITADSGSNDIIVTLISTGAGLTQASTFVNSAGTAVTPATTYTAATVSSLVTVTRATGTQAGFAEGMIMNITLAGGDTITLRDGTVLAAPSVVPVRIGGTIVNGGGAGDTFQFGPTTDSTIAAASVTAAVVAVAPRPARGTAAELTSRGIVGAASSTTYSEVLVNWLETPPNGGAPISKAHSVFVDSTTSSANHAAFRFNSINLMNAVSSNTSAFQTTANPEASSIN